MRYALDKETNLKYAVKIYENYRLVDPQKKRNLQREIGLLEKLDHPCIIKLYKIVKTSTSVNILEIKYIIIFFLDEFDHGIHRHNLFKQLYQEQI